MKKEKKQSQAARGAVLCGLFTALIAVGAFLRIPVPYLAFTLQTLFVALAGMLLGKKAGTVSVLVYLAIGLVGLPIFTRGGGIGYVLQPSFGFLVGFSLYAWLAGAMTEKISEPTVKKLLAAQLPGLFAMYAVALPYYYLVTNLYLDGIGVQALLLYCFAATLPGDILKSLLAAWLGKRLMPVLRKTRASRA